ncbi:MAG: helicase-associated domain-containing protein [Austwickia sp.]|nr:helicase-associated domain-containing protein [Austwickia sp.]
MPPPAPPAGPWIVPVRSLADDLRGRSPDQIADLIAARPDLVRPSAGDLSAVAARACTRAAVYRALDDLDTGGLRIFQALALSGDPVDLDAAAALAGCPRERVEPALEEFWRHALAWRSADGVHLVREAVEALGPHPGGLAPDHPEDATQARRTKSAIEAVLAQAPPPAAAIVEHLVWGPPVALAEPGGRTAEAVDHLLAAGILRRGESPGQVVLPAPVALALREGRLAPGPPGLDPPQVWLTPVRPPDIAAGAGTAASTVLEHLDELAQAWGEQPPRVLRSGGLGVRDLREVATRLDLPVPHAAFLIELGYAAGLIDDDGELEPVWAPTPGYDEWLALPAGRRWLVLVSGWLASHRAAHLVGRREPDGPAVNALADGVSWPPIRAIRVEVLADLYAVPADSAAVPDDLVARLGWRHPLRAQPPLAQAVQALLQEAGWLGLTYAGALGPPGRALWELQGPSPDRTAESALERLVDLHLPVPVERILLQADLTAVAPGRLEGPAARFLRLAADIESRGGATVYRFSPHSLRRALDAGWSADQVHSALVDLAGGSPGATEVIPQPLAYLITDTARRHGLIRVGATATYLRSDDPVGLDELVADRRLTALRLRRVSPGVALSPSALATALSLLRTHGYSPVAEDGDGAVVLTPRHHRRAPLRRPRIGYAGAQPSARPPVGPGREEATAMAAELIAAEDARQARLAAARNAPEPVDVPDCDPIVTQMVLRDAAAARRPVRIGVSDATGRVRALTVLPERVSGGRLDAVDTASGAPLTFSIARLTGAKPHE